MRLLRWLCLQWGALKSGFLFSRTSDFVALWKTTVVHARATRAFGKPGVCKDLALSYWRGRIYALAMLIPETEISGGSPETQQALLAGKMHVQKGLKKR
jgi:hypothetical protein